MASAQVRSADAGAGTQTDPPRPVRRDRGLMPLAVPSLAWYVFFTVGPLLAMFVVAFTDWAGLATQGNFTGLANLRDLVVDDRLYTAIWNATVHLVGSLPVMMVASFMLGYFLQLKLPGHRVLRVIMFVPALISLSALGTLFIAVFSPTA
jgi:multiple sugar transport system permease protein